MKRIVAIVSFCFCLAGPILNAETVRVSVDQVLDFTGLHQQLALFPVTINKLFDQQGQSFSGDTLKQIQKIITTVFAGEEFENSVKQELIDSYDQALFEQLKKDYADSLVSEITKAEVEFAALGDMGVSQGFDFRGLSKERQKIIGDLIHASDAINQQEILVRSSLQVFITTLNLFMPPEQQIKPELAQQIIESTVKEIHSEAYLLRTKQSTAQCYARFNDAQLATYLELLMTDEYQWVNKGFYAGFIKASQKAMQMAADMIKETIVQETNA